MRIYIYIYILQHTRELANHCLQRWPSCARPRRPRPWCPAVGRATRRRGASYNTLILLPYYTTLHYTTLHYTILHYTILHYTRLYYYNRFPSKPSKRKPSPTELVMPSRRLCRQAARRDFPCLASFDACTSKERAMHQECLNLNRAGGGKWTSIGQGKNIKVQTPL